MILFGLLFTMIITSGCTEVDSSNENDKTAFSDWIKGRATTTTLIESVLPDLNQKIIIGDEGVPTPITSSTTTTLIESVMSDLNQKIVIGDEGVPTPITISPTTTLIIIADCDDSTNPFGWNFCLDLGNCPTGFTCNTAECMCEPDSITPTPIPPPSVAYCNEYPNPLGWSACVDDCLPGFTCNTADCVCEPDPTTTINHLPITAYCGDDTNPQGWSICDEDCPQGFTCNTADCVCEPDPTTTTTLPIVATCSDDTNPQGWSVCENNCPQGVTCNIETCTCESGPYSWVLGATIIDGNAYPAHQFVFRPSDSGCSESYLAPALDKYNTAYHVDFDEVGLTWAGGGCGSFGTISTTSYVGEYPITDEQATDWENRFGTSLKEFQYVP